MPNRSNCAVIHFVNHFVIHSRTQIWGTGTSPQSLSPKESQLPLLFCVKAATAQPLQTSWQKVCSMDRTRKLGSPALFKRKRVFTRTAKGQKKRVVPSRAHLLLLKQVVFSIFSNFSHLCQQCVSVQFTRLRTFHKEPIKTRLCYDSA